MDKIALLEDKRVILGVCGSIAVYKAVDLASKLTQAGALVDVVMTAAARRFVTPLTFQAVSGRPVYSDLWRTDDGGGLADAYCPCGIGRGCGSSADRAGDRQHDRQAGGGAWPMTCSR